MDHAHQAAVAMGISQLTCLVFIAVLAGIMVWQKRQKLKNRIKDLEGNLCDEENLLAQDIEYKAKLSKLRQVGADNDIIREIHSLHKDVYSLKDTVQDLESREDIRLSGIISSLNFINANREKLDKGRKALQDLHDTTHWLPVHTLKSNEYLQSYQHVVDILEPTCGIPTGLIFTEDELLLKLRQIKIQNGLMEDELLQKLKQASKKLSNRTKDLAMILDDLNKEVVKGDHVILMLTNCNSAKLLNKSLYLEKRIESLICKKDVVVAGVMFLCNFLDDAISCDARTLNTFKV